MSAGKFEASFNPKVAEALIGFGKQATGYPALLGMKVDRVEPGVITTSLEIRPEHLSPIGVVHGGVIASLIDHTLSLAVYPLVEVGKWVATVEFKVNYLGWSKEGTITARGTVEVLKRKISVVRVEVENNGQTIALAQGTLYVRDQVAGV